LTSLDGWHGLAWTAWPNCAGGKYGLIASSAQAKTLMTSKMSLFEDFGYRQTPGRYVIANMEMCGRVAK
jgi:hypothetical protein